MVEAIRDQAGKLCHSTLLGLSHVPALEFAEEFLKLVPPHLTRIFFSDSGAAAVEAALRIALEWWKKTPERRGDFSSRRSKLASLVDAYHGDTLGAVGVGYSPGFHLAVASNVIPSFRVPPPLYFQFSKLRSEEAALEGALQALEHLFEEEGKNLAAFIVEPLCQGAAGVWTHPVEYLRAIADLCRQYEVLLICDEVATGFGKSGRMFAFEQAGIKPDLLVLGKGLTGGMLPMSAVLATEQLFEGFLGDPEESCALYYGQTFAGNPLACAAALASLRLFHTHQLLEHLPERIAFYEAELAAHLLPLEHVEQVRTLGLMTGIELTQKKGGFNPYSPASRASWKVVLEARKRGVVIRPLGNVIILMPAVSLPKAELARLVTVTGEAIRAALGE
jgi:adenosylmethionine-8-amino-7-oxononanoate aminotransferase